MGKNAKGHTSAVKPKKSTKAKIPDDVYEAE
jgi:hypothetical protein